MSLRSQRPGARSTVLQGLFAGHRPPLPVARPPAGPALTAQARPAAQHLQAALARGDGETPTVSRPPVQPFGQAEVFEVPPSLDLSGRGGGEPLPQKVRQKMEKVFDADFSDVRVHVGREASAIGAIAFTHGSNIFFAQGFYNPATPHGQQLIGHELTHVLQQRAGRVRNPLGSGVAVVQDPGMEAEAERMGMRVAQTPEPIQAKPANPSRTPASADRGEQPAQRKGGEFWVSHQPLEAGRRRLVVHRGGQSLGQADVYPDGPQVAKVYNLKVDPAFRGQGAGDALLRAAARTSAQMGRHRLAVDSEDNGSGRLTRWYQREGFHRVGTNDRGMAVLEAPAQAFLAHRGVSSRDR